MMTITRWADCNEQQQAELLRRPASSTSATVIERVADIIAHVAKYGDRALRDYSARFDHYTIEHLEVDEQQCQQAINSVDSSVKQVIQRAYQNIACFHRAQETQPITIETETGVTCQQVTRPISRVGLYIPGGSAPLFSTVLMLAIPAQIAGCKAITLCSPPPIANEILYAATLCGITQIYQVGGAQAIAAMAYGTESISPVDKLFGPGNAYVTEAKKQVSQRCTGVAIDMPAGPSEVLVIADEFANANFIAADLLSQAEHGEDSQVILVTPSQDLAKSVNLAVKQQCKYLSRSKIAEHALASSRIIVTPNLAECVNISNRYAPEHLIIQTENADSLVESIQHAGSIFLGCWSPESVGDYASGTNHVLPTYGYSRTYSSLGLADFQKRMTIQTLSQQGLLNLGPIVELMAKTEQLTAHQYAVTVRIAAIKQKNKG